MKIPYDSLVALKVAFQMRLEFLEEEIMKAEQSRNKNNIDFWVERHEALKTAIVDLEQAIK